MKGRDFNGKVRFFWNNMRNGASGSVGLVSGGYKLEAEDIGNREISTHHLESLCASHLSQWNGRGAHEGTRGHLWETP